MKIKIKQIYIFAKIAMFLQSLSIFQVFQKLQIKIKIEQIYIFPILFFRFWCLSHPGMDDIFRCAKKRCSYLLLFALFFNSCYYLSLFVFLPPPPDFCYYFSLFVPFFKFRYYYHFLYFFSNFQILFLIFYTFFQSLVLFLTFYTFSNFATIYHLLYFFEILLPFLTFYTFFFNFWYYFVFLPFRFSVQIVQLKKIVHEWDLFYYIHCSLQISLPTKNIFLSSNSMLRSQFNVCKFMHFPAVFKNYKLKLK